MDPKQFDTLSRTLAHASSRRQAMARIGTAGLLAALASAFGRGRSEALPAVQGETCLLDVVATVRVGPDATEPMQTDVPGELRGQISFSLGSDGAIDEGRFLLDGGPEVPVVGQATGRAINLRADLQAVQEGLTLVLVGTAEDPLERCRGAVDGYITGPLPGDLGDWHATATADRTRASTAPPPGPSSSSRTTIPSGQSCGPGLTRCGSACVNLGSDRKNCGACGSDCPAPFSCIEGACRCPGEFGYSCTGVCIDLGSDPANCGSCGNVCGQGRSCVNGACVGSCEPGFTLCNGVCVDLNSDYFNCGRCRNVCGGGDAPYICQGGQCVLVDTGACAPGLTDCGGICVDLSSDLNNCGACGEICESGLVPVECRSGICERASCPVGIEYCGAADLCRDLSSDPDHCGACGNACPSGVCSGGVCQSVIIDEIPLNEAPPDEVSPCLPGLTYCGNGVCVDIFIDSFNCGACGITCQFPQGCQGGVCVG